ncbi:hypothetical protein ACFY93_02030 [Streptomyces sp. NPDC008313]|uniref:hypothetical protein n=1 Tax=Streptomyces sp. NPDC008313 TaxID=3364826 RepID=UPI0036E2C32F
MALEPDAPEEVLESVDTLAARLTPPGGRRRTRPRSDVVRATLQLPGVLEAGEPLEPWPAQSLIAKALGISQPTVPTGTLSAALASYTRSAAERVGLRVVELAERSGPRTVLLAHEAGLIARYWEAGGRELLAGLQQSARRPADRPHGLWLLLPAEDPHATPTLDGRTVEVVDRATEWEVLDGLFLKSLRPTGSPS